MNQIAHELSTGINFNQIHQALSMSGHEEIQCIFEVTDLDSITSEASHSVKQCLLCQDNACVFHKKNETFIIFHGNNKNFVLIKVESKFPHLLEQMVQLPNYV